MKAVGRFTRRRRAHCGKSKGRRGSALVEFSVVAPLLFSTIFLFVELDRYVFAINAMEEAARTGCRLSIVNGAKLDDVEEGMRQVLATAGIEIYTATDSPELDSTFEQGDPVTVTITAAYQDVSWLPALRYLGNQTIEATSTLPREG